MYLSMPISECGKSANVHVTLALTPKPPAKSILVGAIFTLLRHGIGSAFCACCREYGWLGKGNPKTLDPAIPIGAGERG